MTKIVLIGYGGHSRVVCDILKGYPNKQVFGYLDNQNMNVELTYLGQEKDFIKRHQDSYEYIICIGDNKTRKVIAQTYDFSYVSVKHKSAIISDTAQIGKGTVVSPGAIVNANSKIGEFSILNSNSVVEHDCNIGDFVHISPNATLGGGVKIEEMCHIGIGAIVLPNVSICENVIIGAGAVVTKNITVSGTYIGVPAKRIKSF